MDKKRALTDLFLLHADFYHQAGEVPICGTYITDLDDRILAQFWLANPNLADPELALKIVDDIFMVIEAKLTSTKLPRKITPEFLDSTALEVVAFLTGRLRDMESDLEYSSLIPSPLWAPQDVYGRAHPPGDEDDWEVTEWK